jgi:hypothetical protein
VLGAGGKGRHAAPVREHGIPAPSDLGEFAASLGRQRHRPIRLRPFSSGPGIPCGLRTSTADAGCIYHEEGTTPCHQMPIAVHELGHMLPDHRGATQVWEGLVNLLVPNADPQLVQLVPGRSMYTTEEERDAGHLREPGPSLYRRKRVAVAVRQGFRVQPEDRAEPGAVDAGVADDSKQFRILPG